MTDAEIAGHMNWRGPGAYTQHHMKRIRRIVEAVQREERERICKAIKEEDDYCVTEGDYMLDSNDCIAVAKGEWMRPDYSVDATNAKGQA